MRLRDAHHRDIPGIQERFDYGSRTDGNPVYKGYAEVDEATGSGRWVVHYYEYNGDGLTTLHKAKVGTWDGRAALFS